MKKTFLVTANDFGSSKTNPRANAQNIIFVAEIWGKKVKYHKRGDQGK
jgi:hypothetical protein